MGSSVSQGNHHHLLRLQRPGCAPASAFEFNMWSSRIFHIPLDFFFNALKSLSSESFGNGRLQCTLRISMEQLGRKVYQGWKGGGHQPRDGRQEAPEAGRGGKEPPLEPLDGAQPWDPLTSDVGSPGLGEGGCLMLKPSSVVICYSRPTPPPARTLRPRPQPGAPGFLLGHIRNAVRPGAIEEVGLWSRAHRHPAALTWVRPSNWGGKPVPRGTSGGRQRPHTSPSPGGLWMGDTDPDTSPSPGGLWVGDNGPDTSPHLPYDGLGWGAGLSGIGDRVLPRDHLLSPALHDSALVPGALSGAPGRGRWMVPSTWSRCMKGQRWSACLAGCCPPGIHASETPAPNTHPPQESPEGCPPPRGAAGRSTGLPVCSRRTGSPWP